MEELLFIETIRVEDGIFVSSRISFACVCGRRPRSIRRRLQFRFGGRFDSASASEGNGEVPDRLRPVAVRDLVCAVCSPRDSLPAAGRCGRRIGLPLKYADRSALARLLQRRDDCDEILIVRDGAITDTSYSNVAFFDGRKYVTPDTFLLNGTRRQYLLGTGVLTERRITPSDLAVSSGSCSSMPCWESRTTSPFRSNGSGIITEGKWHNRRVADPAF